MRLIAHRGASADQPEHTRAAYLQAIADGADGIETDVRLTADGYLVCWHDDTLDRTTGVPGRVRETTLAAMQTLDLFRGRAVADGLGAPDEQLMTLHDLLTVLRDAGRPLLLALELKPDAGDEADLVDSTLAILDAEGWDPATGRLGDVEVSVMCFSLPVVRLLVDRVAAPVVMLLTDPEEPDQAEGAALLDTTAVSVGPGIDQVRSEPGRVSGWLEAQKTVRVWTVDEADDLDFLLGLGVREITTNRPLAVRAAIAGSS